MNLQSALFLWPNFTWTESLSPGDGSQHDWRSGARESPGPASKPRAAPTGLYEWWRCVKAIFSPMLSSGAHSDECVILLLAAEGADELSTSEEFGLEVENWAKALAHLWQNRPTNLKKEKEYNQRMGCKPPYCSICALFHTYQQVTLTWADPVHLYRLLLHNVLELW